MKRTKGFIIILIFSALSLCLASCAQGEVNGERLSNGLQNETDPGGGIQGPFNGGTHQTNYLTNVRPFDFDDYIDIENSTFKDNHVELLTGKGTVLYTVTSAKLYDSLAGARISEESYAVSGSEKYDHYIKIDMTVKNVDVSDTGEEYNVNNFILAGHVDFYFLHPVWFSQGGSADGDGRGYFHFYLPPAGETVEISIAFGLSDSHLAAFRKSDGIWLTYDIPTLQRLRLEGLL